MMNIVGRVQLNNCQSRDLEPGATIDLPLAQFREHVPYRARIGDVVWVQEPFIFWIEKRGRKKELYRPGPLTRQWPNTARNGFNFLESHHSFEAAKLLPRKHSMATLEIMGFSDGAVRCLIHACQVDEFVKTRAAA